MAKIRINGDTSGYIEISAPSVAGSTSITLPATTGGNFLVTDSSGNLNVDSGTLYVDATNNRVGVGTTSPSNNFQVTFSATAAVPSAGASGNCFAVGSSAYGITGGALTNGNSYFQVTRWDGTATNYDLLLQPNGGRVGIGTTSPNALFQVSGGSAPIVRVTDTRNTVNLDLQPANTEAYFGTQSNHPLAFQTNATERARIDSSGRLLVGTSSAETSILGSLLQIQSASGGGGSIIVGRHTANAGGPYLYFTKSRGTSVTSTTIVQNGDELGNIRFAGADGSSQIGSYGAEIRAEVDGTPGSNDMPGRLVLSTTADGASSPTERMRITNNGTVYFGPGSGSALNSAAFVPDGSLSPYLSFDTNYGGGTKTNVEFRRNGTTAGSITSTSTTTAYNTSSDYRLKENITLVTDGVARLQQLKPSRFNFKIDPTNTVDGFLAHEVQQVIPEAITGEKDAVDADGNPIYQGIDQSKLVPLLTAALQEAIGRIETLEAANASLEARLTALEVKP